MAHAELWTADPMGQEKGEKMNKNIIICKNKSCPNNNGKGCDRTFVTMDAAGKCLSADQKPAAGYADNDTAQPALMPAT